jgi:hypothetical protein
VDWFFQTWYSSNEGRVKSLPSYCT